LPRCRYRHHRGDLPGPDPAAVHPRPQGDVPAHSRRPWNVAITHRPTLPTRCYKVVSGSGLPGDVRAGLNRPGVPEVYWRWSCRRRRHAEM